MEDTAGYFRRVAQGCRRMSAAGAQQNDLQQATGMNLDPATGDDLTCVTTLLSTLNSPHFMPQGAFLIVTFSKS